MASVPRTAAVASAAPAQSSRHAVPTARVASSSTSQIDALSAGTNISFDTAASGFQDNGSQSQSYFGSGGGSRQRYVEPGVNRLFTADSQAFAAIFEAPAIGKPTAASNGGTPRRSSTPVSRIINTYETNALVISGKQPVRGTSFSFNL